MDDQDEYKTKLKNIFLITENKSKSFYKKNISIDKINTNSITTFDNFDFLNKKNLNEDGYYIHNKFPFQNNTEIKNVKYKLNKFGFRTKNFESNKKFILTSGCSNTFGIGLPEQYIWPSLLKDKVNKKIDVYNLAFPGHGYFMIIKNIFNFIKQYGKPEAIFIMFPNLNRDIYFSKIKKDFVAQVINVSHVFHGNNDMKNFVLNYDEGANILKTISYLNALEMFCNSAGIKFAWTTWADKEIIELIKFDNFYFFENLYYNNLSKNKEYKNLIDKENLYMWDIAGDNAHPGINWQYTVFKSFYDLYLE